MKRNKTIKAITINIQLLKMKLRMASRKEKPIITNTIAPRTIRMFVDHIQLTIFSNDISPSCFNFYYCSTVVYL